LTLWDYLVTAILRDFRSSHLNGLATSRPPSDFNDDTAQRDVGKVVTADATPFESKLRVLPQVRPSAVYSAFLSRFIGQRAVWALLNLFDDRGRSRAVYVDPDYFPADPAISTITSLRRRKGKVQGGL
jgi:hypothetical protein